MNFDDAGEMPEDLLVFYHPETLRQISALRKHLLERDRTGTLTSVDRWIRMVAVNRLTGHSTGFFSVIRCRQTRRYRPALRPKSTRDSIRAHRLGTFRASSCRRADRCLRDVTAGLRGDLAGVADSARIVVGAFVEYAVDRRQLRRAGRDVSAVSRRGGLQGRQLVAMLVQRHRRGHGPRDPRQSRRTRGRRSSRARLQR